MKEESGGGSWRRKGEEGGTAELPYFSLKFVGGQRTEVAL